MRHSFRTVNGYKAKLIDRIKGLNPSLANELREIKLDWYTISNKVADDTGESTAEVLIYDEIGGSFGVSAEEFATELAALDVQNIDIRINSPGGSVFDSIAIYNAIVRHPANVTTYVDGLAASAASIIAMAGDKCVMMVGSQMMIHDALAAEMGNAKDFRAMADFLDAQSDNLASIYKVKAGGTTEGWRELMLAETWMFAEEAVTMKLADEVYVKPEPDSEDPEDDSEAEPPDAKNYEEADITAALHRRHRLTNRGFKYTGREKAPGPSATLFAELHGAKNTKTDNYSEAVARYLASCK